MRTDKQFYKSMVLAVLLGVSLATVGIAQDTSTMDDTETKAPVILIITPTGSEMNVDPNNSIEITFNSEMDESTINGSTLLLHVTSADTVFEVHNKILDDQMNGRSAMKDSENSKQNTTDAVDGTISYSNNVAVFTPDKELKEDTQYTFTVTNGVKSLENIALKNDHFWSFTATDTSESTYSDKQNVKFNMEGKNFSKSTTDATQKGETNMIDLGKAGQFVILAKTNINNESDSRITGNIGEGFVGNRIKKEKGATDSARKITTVPFVELQSNQRDKSSQDVTEAIHDMMFAYSDASMQNGDSLINHKNENFNDTVLSSGIHEWSDSLHIESDVTLSGGTDDVWLFKVGDNLTVDENTVFTLTNGARAENIFWYVEGEVTIGKKANFEGIILSMNDITLEKNANLNGRMFSQTSITLEDNTVTEPVNMAGQTTSTNR